MRLHLKFIEGEMSNQKKLKLTFSDDTIAFHVSETDEPVILETDPNQRTGKDDHPDWREAVRGVSERNLIALKNSILTDITLEVGPNNTPFQAHKLILALGSPVFEAMFYGPLAEVGEKINIPDILPDGIQVLLRFLYGDIACLNNEIEALHTWIAADKYCVPELKKICDKFFSNCPVSSSNVWQLLENATLFSLNSLISRCKKYLEKHTESALCGNYFLETNVETVKQLLQVSSANVSELVLLKSVIHWGRHKVEKGELVSLTDVLKPLMEHIRFGALTPIEFCQFLEETGNLLENSDALAILKHLTQPLLYALPQWCCTTTWQRTCGPFASTSSVPYTHMERISKLVTESRRREAKLKFKKLSSSHRHSP